MTDLDRPRIARQSVVKMAGMKGFGYVGNTPLTEWLPPSADALRHAGLDQS